MEIAVGMHQDQGKREYQQDAMSIKPFSSIGGVLAILADGMGGYEGGEIASQLVSDNLREFTIEGDDIGDSLKKYLLKGNDAIAEYKKEHPNVKSMGTTGVAFFMTDKKCQWVSVGDSPLYVIRDRNSIKRINENHSVAGLLDLQVKKGEISQEEALSSGQRHMLTSAVSGENIPQIDVSTSWPVKENDIFILASDGIETISEDRIKEIVVGLTASGVTQENIQKACEALVQDVLHQETKNQDNVTVIILAKMGDGEPKTAIYNGSYLDFKEKKKLTLPLAIGAGVAALILIGLFMWFMSSDEKKEQKVGGEVNTTAVQPELVQKAVEPTISKPVTEEKVNTEQNETTSKVKSEENDTLESDETTVKKVEKVSRKNNNNEVQPSKQTAKLEKKSKHNLIQTQDVAPEEIKKRNDELEKSGGV